MKKTAPESTLNNQINNIEFARSSNSSQFIENFIYSYHIENFINLNGGNTLLLIFNEKKLPNIFMGIYFRK